MGRVVQCFSFGIFLACGTGKNQSADYKLNWLENFCFIRNHFSGFFLVSENKFLCVSLIVFFFDYFDPIIGDEKIDLWLIALFLKSKQNTKFPAIFL